MRHPHPLLLGAALCAAATGAAQARGIPQSIVPWQEPQHWPHDVGDAPPYYSDHFVVHYSDEGDHDMAVEVLGHLDAARAHQTAGGGLPPLDDHGIAGDDGKVDVYLWRGIDTMYVDSVAANDDTWWDDTSTYMVLDPWGKYGVTEEERRANIYHELRHAGHQAATDWWEDYPIFEADATLWEARAFGFQRLSYVWADYQARADWFPLKYDAFRTWAMYGAALYLDFVSHRWFGGTLGFTNAMWLDARNEPGAELDPSLNEPDFLDALAGLLPAGTSIADTMVGFTRARFYTGSRAGAASQLTSAALLGEVTPRVHARGGSAQSKVRVDAEIYGSAYVTVVRGAQDGAELRLSIKSGGQKTAGFVVQTVGAGAGDQVLDLAAPRRVRFGADGRLHLAVTVVPAPGAAFDPDLRDATRYPVDLVFDRL
jgi:hypothetical protein